jgi:hypothetical protein
MCVIYFQHDALEVKESLRDENSSAKDVAYNMTASQFFSWECGDGK